MRNLGEFLMFFKTLEVQMVLLHPDVMRPPSLHNLDVLVGFDLSLNIVEVSWSDSSDLLQVLESDLT